jgi:hypothetical protein
LNKIKRNRTEEKQWRDADRFTSNLFRPYAEAIGQVALAWNHLHETLGTIFLEVAFEGSLKAEDAWQSLIVDRAKREMLKAVLDGMTAHNFPELPRLRDELVWIIEQTNAAEDGRNNAIHTPLVSHDHPVWREIKPIPGISSYTHHGNRRAKKLDEKDVLSEYRYYRDKLITLQRHAERLLYWQRGSPWPKRPKLPSRKIRKKARSTNVP